MTDDDQADDLGRAIDEWLHTAGRVVVLVIHQGDDRFRDALGQIRRATADLITAARRDPPPLGFDPSAIRDFYVAAIGWESGSAPADAPARLGALFYLCVDELRRIRGEATEEQAAEEQGPEQATDGEGARGRPFVWDLLADLGESDNEQARLLALMADRDSAPLDLIKEEIHGDRLTRIGAIRTNVHRVNRLLKGRSLPTLQTKRGAVRWSVDGQEGPDSCRCN